MKTLINITIGFLSLLILRQEPVSKVAEINVPKNSTVLTKDAGKKYVKENFKLIAIPTMQNVYKVQDVILSFQDYDMPYDVDLKIVAERTFSNPESDQMKKLTVAGEILKYKYQSFHVKTVNRENEHYYYFMSESKSKKGVLGCLAFKQKDQDKAKAILDSFLNGVKFK